MVDTFNEDSGPYSRFDRFDKFREALETVKLDVRDLRALRDADQRIMLAAAKESSDWRSDIRSRMDNMAAMLDALRLDVAREGRRAENQASPVTAALSAAGGGGGALLIYLVARAIGVLPQ